MNYLQKEKSSLQYCVAAAAKSLQSCLTLCDPIDSSPPGSSVPGSLQARILEWVAISFSNACMHAKSLQSCPTLCDTMDSSPPGSSVQGILQARILEWVANSFSQYCVRSIFRSDQIRSDQISCSVVSDSFRPPESQHARPPCPSSIPGVHSDSSPSSQ